MGDFFTARNINDNPRLYRELADITLLIVKD